MQSTENVKSKGKNKNYTMLPKTIAVLEKIHVKFH